MTKTEITVELERIDPARNMRRFYIIEVSCDLFGAVVTRRSWGRIGTFGKSLDRCFSSQEEAVREAERLERLKRQRGYRERWAR